MIIPIKKSVKYLGVWLNGELLEESRIVRSLSARTKNLFRPNKQISLCSHKSKKLLTNSYGSIYGDSIQNGDALQTFPTDGLK